jgi:tRNA G18 (ribose-2'-O)-methylase SpoU
MDIIIITIASCILTTIYIYISKSNVQNNQILEKNYPEGITKYNIDNQYKHHSPIIIKQISKKLTLPIHLMLFNLTGDANIALAIRTAAVFGCSHIWIVGKKKYNRRALVGSHNYITIHKIDTVDTIFFEKHNLQPFIVEQCGIPLEDIKFKKYMNKSVCFIVGSEREGIPKEFMKSMKNTPIISISQYGMIKSLNVSIASSIIIYEYCKQLRHSIHIT